MRAPRSWCHPPSNDRSAAMAMPRKRPRRRGRARSRLRHFAPSAVWPNRTAGVASLQNTRSQARRPTRDRVSGRKRKRACGVRYFVRTPCRGRRSGGGKPEDPWAVRAADRSSSATRSRSGKSAAPASPAAARRRPCPPGGTLAVRPRPETKSRVGLLAPHAAQGLDSRPPAADRPDRRPAAAPPQPTRRARARDRRAEGAQQLRGVRAGAREGCARAPGAREPGSAARAPGAGGLPRDHLGLAQPRAAPPHRVPGARGDFHAPRGVPAVRRGRRLPRRRLGRGRVPRGGERARGPGCGAGRELDRGHGGAHARPPRRLAAADLRRDLARGPPQPARAGGHEHEGHRPDRRPPAGAGAVPALARRAPARRAHRGRGQQRARRRAGARRGGDGRDRRRGRGGNLRPHRPLPRDQRPARQLHPPRRARGARCRPADRRRQDLDPLQRARRGRHPGPHAEAVRRAWHRSHQDRVAAAARATVGVRVLLRSEGAPAGAAGRAGARRGRARRDAAQSPGLVPGGAARGLMDLRALVPEWIRTLTPYPPGKPIEELERELGIRDSIKLASNENPLGPSPKAVAAITAALGDLHRYPDGSAFHLKRRLAERLGVSVAEVIVGNGSNELIEFAVRTFLRPGDEAVMADQAFVVYRLVVQAAGGTSRVVPLRDFTHDLEAVAAAVTPRTRLVFLGNPNNPTGTIFRRAAWRAFLGLLPAHLLVVADDAYAEHVL